MKTFRALSIIGNSSTLKLAVSGWLCLPARHQQTPEVPVSNHSISVSRIRIVSFSNETEDCSKPVIYMRSSAWWMQRCVLDTDRQRAKWSKDRTTNVIPAKSLISRFKSGLIFCTSHTFLLCWSSWIESSALVKLFATYPGRICGQTEADSQSLTWCKHSCV